MDIKTFSEELDYLNKSESEMFHDFIIKEDLENKVFDDSMKKKITPTRRDALPKDLSLDRVITISQQTKDGEINDYQFKVSEIWSTPENFFSLVSVNDVNDDVNIWTLFYIRNKQTWYMKKANKGIVNVHVAI